MKKYTLPFIILIFVVILGFVGYSMLNKQNVQNAVVPSEKTTTKTNTVLIQNFAFNPETLTVKKGDEVTWTNNDSTIHQIKSDTFNSQELSNGQSFSFTFNDTGTFNYSCLIHPSMQGKIVVN